MYIWSDVNVIYYILIPSIGDGAHLPSSPWSPACGQCRQRNRATYPTCQVIAPRAIRHVQLFRNYSNVMSFLFNFTQIPYGTELLPILVHWSYVFIISIPQFSNAGPVSPVTSQWSVLTSRSVLTSQSRYPNINHTCNVISKYDNYYLLTPQNRVHELDLSLGAVAIMTTSSNGNIFRVTGPLCGEFDGDRWIPRTKASDSSAVKSLRKFAQHTAEKFK